MACDDTWYNLPIPCPECGGTVQYWYYGISHDCPPSSGQNCLQCGKEFSHEQWKQIELFHDTQASRG